MDRTRKNLLRQSFEKGGGVSLSKPPSTNTVRYFVTMKDFILVYFEFELRGLKCVLQLNSRRRPEFLPHETPYCTDNPLH
jgi:hypothetical protein